MSGNNIANSSAVKACALFNSWPLNPKPHQNLNRRKEQFKSFDKNLRIHLSDLGAPELADFLVWIPYNELRNVNVLDQGGSGMCNKAEITNLGEVAVKNVKVTEMSFLAHATYHSQPTESPTLPVYGLSRNDNKYFAIMELGSCCLEYRLSTSTFRNFDAVHDYATIIAERLRQVHALGIIHKDLNPKNLVLRSSGHDVLIIDFGLSTTIDDPSCERGSYGREEYLPPEALTAGLFTAAYDIHCLGSVMWHLLPSVPLCRKYPKIGREEVPGVPIEYTSIYADCWNEDPNKRPTIDVVIERLRACKPQSTLQTPWPKEALDYFIKRQDAENECKSTGSTEVPVESRSSSMKVSLSTSDNADTYAPSHVASPESQSILGSPRVSELGESDVKSTCSGSSVSLRIKAGKAGKEVQYFTSPPRNSSRRPKAEYLAGSPQSTPTSIRTRLPSIDDDDETPLDSDSKVFPISDNEADIPDNASKRHLEKRKMLEGNPVGKITDWNPLPRQPHPECCVQLRAELEQVQAQFRAKLEQVQAQFRAKLEQVQAQFRAELEQVRTELALPAQCQAQCQAQSQQSPQTRSKFQQGNKELVSIGNGFKQTVKEHSRVINNHAPPVAELARKAEGPSAVPKKPRKAAANTAVQPAQSTDNNNSPVRSRPRDPIRILIDTPAELSAQPSNLATTAPAQSPATGSPQMVTARSPNSANGLLTGITTGRLTQPPDRNRKRLLARKAQPSGGNVSSREIHTPIGKLKGPPVPIWR